MGPDKRYSRGWDESESRTTSRRGLSEVTCAFKLPGLHLQAPMDKFYDPPAAECHACAGFANRLAAAEAHAARAAAKLPKSLTGVDAKPALMEYARSRAEADSLRRKWREHRQGHAERPMTAYCEAHTEFQAK